MGRKRKLNFREPTIERVQTSVSMMVDTAREMARSDHKDSFASKKEGDLIASVYLRQALDRITDEIG